MWKRFERIPLLPISAAGFLLGIMLGILSGGSRNLLEAERLCSLKEMTLKSGRLFYEILKVRGGTVLVLLMAGTTYLAPATCILTALWIGMCFGIFQVNAVLQFGIKGILLLPAATMPQFLIYLPTYYFLLRWCEKLYRTIYLRSDWKKWNAFLSLILILASMAAGAFLECLVSPRTWQAILNIF